MCIYIYIYIYRDRERYTYIYIYIYIHTYICIYTHIMYIYIYIYVLDLFMGAHLGRVPVGLRAVAVPHALGEVAAHVQRLDARNAVSTARCKT